MHVTLECRISAEGTCNSTMSPDELFIVSMILGNPFLAILECHNLSKFSEDPTEPAEADASPATAGI